MLVVGRREIEAVLDLGSIAPAIEQAFIAASAGEIELPPVGHITFPEVDGDCHIKFGHRRGDPDFVIKVAAGFPQQAASGAPTGNGLSLVVSAETGQIRAVLHDEMLLTDVRTGIGGAVATRLLARPDAVRLLVVGTGVQARHQIEAHVALLDRALEVSVWGRSLDAAARVVADVEPTVGAAVASDLREACAEADIIVTCTSATVPLVLSDWIRPGCHITAVGADAPGKHELDPQLLRRADLVVADSRAQCLDHGELSAVAGEAELESPPLEIGDILAGSIGRRHSDDVTIADLTGTAAQDIAIARYVLDALT
ncbi:MAG: ornithine cyclodeaminase family protein [Acidimicrobiales bacterium]